MCFTHGKFEMKLINTLLLILVLLTVQCLVSYAHAADYQYYHGTLTVNKVSGGACKPDSVGKIYEIEIVLKFTGKGYEGFYGSHSGDTGTGKISGTSLNNLAVEYAKADSKLVVEHRLKLSSIENRLTGALIEQHIDESIDDCNKDYAVIVGELSLPENNTWQKLVNFYEIDRLINVSGDLLKSKKATEALQLFEELLKLNTQARGYYSELNSLIIELLINVYNELGRANETATHYKRALDIKEKVSGPEHPDTAMSLNNLASLYMATGRYSEAEKHYKRALTIRERTLGPEHPDTAISLNNLALLYETTGRYVEAELLFKRALLIDEKLLGPNHPGTATSINNLAALYMATGRYAEAETFLKQSLLFNEKAFGPGHPNTATSINNLASLYEATGRYTEAEPLYKRSLSIRDREKIFGNDHPDTAMLLNNLASLYHTTGRYGEAEPLLKRVLSVREKTLGTEHPDTATSLNNLALTYQVTGRYSEAEPLLKRALSITEKVFGSNHPDTAGSLNSLALLFKSTGRYTEAEPLYNRSLSIYAKSGVPIEYATTLNNYSYFLSSQRSPSAAIFLGKQAVNILQGVRQNVSKIDKEVLRSFDKSIHSKYQHLADLLIEQGRLAEAQQVLSMLKEEEYFEFIRRDAGSANRLTTKASYIASEEPWLKEYEAISAQNAKLGKELGELRQKAKYFPLSEDEKVRLAKLLKEDEQAIATFNNYMSRLLKAMKEESKANINRIEDIGAKQLKSLTTLKSMLKDLGEGSVLLHYLITDKKLHIILTTPDTQLVRHSVINAKELNKKIFALRDALTNPKLDPRPLAKELYDLLIGPVAKDLETSKAKTLMLSLDGPLRYLPFSALYDGTTYVVQSYRTVMYAEAARDKVALPAKQEWKVAALGVSDKVNAAFPPLPNVPAELNAIVKNDTGGIIPGEIRLNKNFTESSLSETSIRNPVVHIASHFRFVPGTDRDSFLLLGDGSTLGLDRLRNSSFFQDSELLTLSACETAMGTTGKGAEIEGFAAIAMNQGAKAVIATLWPVLDKSTALLMKEFYRLKEEKNLPKVEALRQAQLELLKGKLKDVDSKLPEQERGGDHTRFKKDKSAPYSHPYYWAPFILIGNWK